LNTLEAIVRDAHLTNLTSLTIIDLIALPPDFQRSEWFAHSLSKLTTLEIAFCAAIPGSYASPEMSYYSLFPNEDGLRRCCGNSEVPWAITTLTLGNEDEQSNLVPLDFSTPEFPHLLSLTLQGLSFRLSNVQLMFILRHAATLQTLVLVDCMTLADEWSVIWECFANELTQLVDLTVQNCMDTETNYFVYGKEMGAMIGSIELMEPEPEIVENDRRAFERFVQIVDDRRNSQA
jgi:hypothetical protein